MSIGTSKISYPNNWWLSIEDMPIWNWNNIIEGGGFRYLIKEVPEEEKIKESDYTKLSSLWLYLQEQHIIEFGIDDMLRHRIKTMIKLIKLNIKFVETGDRVLLNFIQMAERELEVKADGIKIRFYKVLDEVTTKKGFDINPKEFSVKKWYHALNNMSNG